MKPLQTNAVSCFDCPNAGTFGKDSRDGVIVWCRATGCVMDGNLGCYRHPKLYALTVTR